MTVRILVIDGAPRETRETHAKAYGKTAAESVAKLLRRIEPEADPHIVLAGDEGASLPDRAAIQDYDAVFVPGSSYHVEDMLPAIRQQLDLVREVFRAQVPAFGSCWGVQLAGVVAGGQACRNPRGPEYGFARRLTLTDEGRGHPLLEGRPLAYDAPAIHLDAVVTPPPDSTVLAANHVLDVQAAEIRHEGGVFWGVQYHPELALDELAVMLESFSHELVEQKLARSTSDVRHFAADLKSLHEDPRRLDLAWRLGLDPEVLDEANRTREIRNFIAHLVKPTMSVRGRA